MSDNSTGLKSQALGGRFKFGGLDAGAVAKAEAALKTLSVNFDQWMKEELGRLEAARDLIRTEGYTAKTAENLYFRAHDIKGLGSTYGYPLVTRIGSSLCRILHDADSRLSAPQALVEAHVDAISAVVRRDMRSDSDPSGRAMAEELENQAARLIPAAA